jgi:hypothetical protein
MNALANTELQKKCDLCVVVGYLCTIVHGKGIEKSTVEIGKAQ